MRRIANKIYAAFDGREGLHTLSGLCAQLIAGQKKSWPKLWQAYESLKDVRVRGLECSGFAVRLQYNAGRMINSLASVDQEDIKERQCFLCAENLPQEQKGIFYRNEYLVLCNPRPVFHSHLTVVHINHRRQEIADNFGMFLQLIADLGSGWVVLYNGPQCGASAPDHLHFQVVPSGQMPIEKEIGDGTKRTGITEVNAVKLYRAKDLGRGIIVLEGSDPVALGNVFIKFQGGLQKVLRMDEEPMMNVAGFYEGGAWRLIVFPRAKHRPDAFFREGDERIVVSPAVIEMGGVIVTPMERDFERLDAKAVEAIYREVSLDAAIVDDAISNQCNTGLK